MSAEDNVGADSTVHAEHQSKLRFLIRSAAALVSTSVVTSGLGFVYWAVAARVFAATDVGESSTAISAMNIIAPFAVLGFGTLLMFELPSMRGGRATLVSTASIFSAVVGAVVALVCAFVLPSDFIGLPGIGHDIGITVLFTAAVATQTVGLLIDRALLSIVGGGLQLVRNTVQAVAKLVLLVALAVTLHRFGSLNIFASWVLANLLSIAVMAISLIRRHHVTVSQMVPDLSALRGLSFDAVKHHTLNISLLVPFFALPIVANVLLGSEYAAYLYATASIAGFIFYLPLSLAMALFASGARDSRTFLMEYRVTLRYSLLISVAANVGIIVLGGLILKIFGAAYADNARTALIVMCLGGLGLIVKDHHVTLARVTDSVGREAVLIGVLSVGEIVGAAVGAKLGGLTGLSLGWAAAVLLEVVVCGPLVWRAYRGRIEVKTRDAVGHDSVADSAQ